MVELGKREAESSENLRLRQTWTDRVSSRERPCRIKGGSMKLTAATAALALIITGAGSALVPAEAAGAAAPQMKISKTGKADGGFVGARSVGGSPMYRIKPDAKPGGRKYQRSKSVRRAAGSTRRSTTRAAWILSEYGTTRDRYTAAAVDVAVFSLLHGGKWRVGSKYTKRRTNQTGAGRTVRGYARTLLKQSRKHSGPYHLSVTVDRAWAGSQTKVTAKLRNRSGRAPHLASWAGTPITIKYPGQKPRTVRTTSSGTATVFVTAAAGTSRVSASARVPDDRLRIRKPRGAKNKSQSPLAKTGTTRTVRGRATGYGTSELVASIESSTSAVWVGRNLPAALKVAGGYGTRTVKMNVYGPTVASNVSCAGTPAWSSSVRTAAERLDLPSAWKPSITGYYRWGAVVTDSAGSTVTACGPVQHARRQLSAWNGVGSDRVVAADKKFGPSVTIGGFDRSEPRTVVTRVYGPFASKASATCTSNYKTSVNASVSTNGTIQPRITNGKTGFFVFRTTVAGSTLFNGVASACSPAYAVSKPLSISQGSGSATKVKVGAPLGPNATVRGFDRNESHTVTTKMYGPFNTQAATTCGREGKLAKSITTKISSNGSTKPRTSIASSSNVGWYVFRSTVSDTTLLKGDTSTCSVAYQVFRG